MPKLILVRGPSGSGKSTFVYNDLKYDYHFEADDYFTLTTYQPPDYYTEYCFDPTKLKQAHEWCLWRTAQALSKGYDVVVSNTFTRIWEMQKYLDLGYPVTVYRCTGQYQNIHGVPDHVVQSMRDRMEDYKGEIYV